MYMGWRKEYMGMRSAQILPIYLMLVIICMCIAKILILDTAQILPIPT